MADEGDTDAWPRTLVSGLENSVAGRRVLGERSRSGPGPGSHEVAPSGRLDSSTIPPRVPDPWRPVPLDLLRPLRQAFPVDK